MDLVDIMNIVKIKGYVYGVIITCLTAIMIHLQVPHTINDSEGQPEESIEFTYESIGWEHYTAGTSGYSLWGERIL